MGVVASTAVQDRLESLEREFRDVQVRLGDPEVFADQQQFIAINKRMRELEPIVATISALRTRKDDVAAAKELFAECEGDEREIWRAEIVEGEAAIEELDAQLKLQLLPKDPNDDRNVLIEIRGAEGGEEANLFARDLFEMYKVVAQRRGWTFEVLSANPSDMGGFTEVIVEMAGDGVWSRMKHEAGPHRVQRVPVTESQGRKPVDTDPPVQHADRIEFAGQQGGIGSILLQFGGGFEIRQRLVKTPQFALQHALVMP